MKPTIGRIVHYCSADTTLTEKGTYIRKPKIMAAIVTKIDSYNDLLVHLRILHSEFEDDYEQIRDFALARVPYCDNYSAGCWSWPARV